MNATFIQNRLSVLYGNHQYRLQNSYIFDWESDLFSVTKTGTIYETEIKISRADFKADFLKPKHLFFKNNKPGYFQQRKEEESESFDFDSGLTEWDIYSGWKRYKKCWQKWHNSEESFMPHRFSFACPPGVIQLIDVPKYAGLIWVYEDGKFEVWRQGPILHRRPLMGQIRMMEILRDKFYYLADSQRRELERLHYLHIL